MACIWTRNLYISERKEKIWKSIAIKYASVWDFPEQVSSALVFVFAFELITKYFILKFKSLYAWFIRKFSGCTNIQAAPNGKQKTYATYFDIQFMINQSFARELQVYIQFNVIISDNKLINKPINMFL